MKPLVSAIIPNYNYSRYVGEAVESALGQTYPNVEVIVIDDGSTDDSLKILAKYTDKIKVIEQVNSGVCVARNRGVAESRGSYVAFLDADDIWLPEKISKQIALLEENADLGLVHVAVREVDACRNSLRTRLNGLAGEASDELLLFEREDTILGGGSGICLRRSVFDAIGGFDERLSTSADWDLFYQVSSRYPVGFVPEILLEYRMHRSNMHGNVARMEKEMLVAFNKAFNGGAKAHKRRSYGNLYLILAGSYFHAGNIGSFLSTAAKCIFYRPSNIFYFLKFPIRRRERASL